MPLDPLPSEILVKDRAAWRESYLRSYRLRDRTAKTIEGTQPYNDASALADQLVVLSANARQIGRSIPLSEVSGTRLDQRAEEEGVPPRFPKAGGIGYVELQTGATGTTLFLGDEVTEPNQQLRYQCVRAGAYLDGDHVPIAAISAGPSTNLDAETVLVWSNPRPGCLLQCTVVAQIDGSGITGGRIEESDDELRLRISNEKANPAVAGNDAAYQRAIENLLGHGVAVQKAFTYPGIGGPGTIGCAFTMRPTSPGGSRIPTSAHRALVRDYVIGQMPKDDSYLDITLVSQFTTIILDLEWVTGAASWADAVPWPPRFATGAGAHYILTAAGPLSFTIAKDDSDYASTPQPVIGKTIGVLNRSTGLFSRKKILSFTGTGPWVITCDSANGASDSSFTPVVSQRVGPWSDSLDTVVQPILDYLNLTGPGEQRATFFDPGFREKRSPPAPKYWPYSVTNRLAANLLGVTTVHDVIIREGLDIEASVGVPGASSYLLELTNLAAFPL